MLALGADLYPVRTGTDRVGHSGLGVELLTQLIEIRHAQIGAQPHRAAVRGQSAQQDANECRLPGAVRADEADPVAPHDAERKIIDDGAVTEAFGYRVELGDQLPRALAGVECQFHVAEAVETLGAFDAQPFQALHPPFVARAARFDAFADPDLFLGPEFIEAAACDLLRRELLVLALFVGSKVAGIGTQNPAIELDDSSRDPIEKGAVVSDDDRGRTLQQQFLEPLDALDVEVVGGFIE